MREVLGEDDGVLVGPDTGEEDHLLVSPALLQHDVGAQQVLTDTAAVAGVQLEVPFGEGYLLSILVVHHVSVPESIIST